MRIQKMAVNQEFNMYFCSDLNETETVFDYWLRNLIKGENCVKQQHLNKHKNWLNFTN